MAQSRRTLTLQPTPDGIAQAAHILRAGGLVAMPTETVYGLAADALNPAAIEAIFVAKDRPHWDPLIVHIAGVTMLHEVVASVGSAAQQLIDAFWPGPLTLLLPRAKQLPSAVTAGRELVGVRMPAHPVARALIAAAGRPLAAPSANRFGHISPTAAAHVLADLDGRIDVVLDAGPCAIGVESTVLDPNTMPMLLYRHGGVSAEAVEHITGQAVHIHASPIQTHEASASPKSLPSPGVGIRHYAPSAHLQLVENEAALRAAIAEIPGGETPAVGVLLPLDWALAPNRCTVVPWASWQNIPELARTLYSGLRALDQPGITTILAPLPEAINSTGLREALRDRMLKAARPS